MSGRDHDAGDKAATRALLAALEPFRVANPTMTLQQRVWFLFVAREPWKSVTEYARDAGLAQGVMTRNCSIGERNRRRRAHRPYLTHNGRSIVGAYRRT